MKKILLTTVVAVCMMTSLAEAASIGRNRRASDEKCHYSVLQQMIRDARNSADLEPIIKGRVDLNAPVKCGGSVLQLAVRRGNPEIVKVLLENGASVQDPVSLKDFKIEGAPDNVSILMFAGYYSPREDIAKLIISAGADVLETDANGENVLWYVEQNPVLRETDLSDSIEQALLFGAPSNDVNGELEELDLVKIQAKKAAMKPVQDKRVPSAERPQQPIITKTADGTVGIVNTPNDGDIVKTIRSDSNHPIREIVEPDIPVK